MDGMKLDHIRMKFIGKLAALYSGNLRYYGAVKIYDIMLDDAEQIVLFGRFVYTAAEPKYHNIINTILVYYNEKAHLHLAAPTKGPRA